jgi:hypothetical protein
VILSDDDLQLLTAEIADECAVGQQCCDPNNPDDMAMLAVVQDTYTCLRELAMWRQTYPGVHMRRIFVTEFGEQTLQ